MKPKRRPATFIRWFDLSGYHPIRIFDMRIAWNAAMREAKRREKARKK